jgi:hypothetical protein
MIPSPVKTINFTEQPGTDPGKATRRRQFITMTVASDSGSMANFQAEVQELFPLQ